MKNCVNCGAPIVNEACEFCGTRYDITAIKSKIAEVQPHKHNRCLNIGEYDVSTTYENLDLVHINGRLATIVNNDVVELYEAYKNLSGNGFAECIRTSFMG